MNIIFNKKFIAIAAIVVVIVIIIICCCTITVGKTSADDMVLETMTEWTETTDPVETESITTETEIESITETETETEVITETETETEIITEPITKEVTEYIPPAVVTEAPSTPVQSVDNFVTYPVASHVWNYLHEADLNNYVIAGIIGNMMAECGGLTLDLQWDIYGGGGAFYGLCQWYYAYFPEIYGASLDGQLEGLLNTMESNFSIFGGSYYPGFTYQDFLNLQDCSSAAIAFARCYERCSEQYVVLRADLAMIAYEYFCG